MGASTGHPSGSTRVPSFVIVIELIESMNGQKKKDKKTNNNNMSVIYKKNLHMKV
jgi:hypothetical protein